MELVGERRRDLDVQAAVAAAGLEQQHPRGGVLGQPVGEHAAGRPGAHDDVVEARLRHRRSICPGFNAARRCLPRCSSWEPASAASPPRSSCSATGSPTSRSSSGRPSRAARGFTTPTRARRATCPSHLYSFSYAQRRDWTRLCSPQEEILDYLNGVARDHGVDRLITGSSTVTSCAWDDELAALDGDHRGGREPRGRSPRARHRSAAPALLPAHRGSGPVRRAHLPLGSVGPRLRPARQARGGDRHRRQRGAVRARGGRAGRAAHGLPAHGQLVHAAQEPGLPAGR